MAHTFPYCLPLGLRLPCVGLGCHVWSGYAVCGSVSAVCGSASAWVGLGLPACGLGSARVWVWVCQCVGLGLPGCGLRSARVWVWVSPGWARVCPCVGLGLPGCGLGSARVWVWVCPCVGLPICGSGSARVWVWSARVWVWVCRVWVWVHPCVGLGPPCGGCVCRVWVRVKLQALVYDILPSEEGAGKRCSECGFGSDVRGFGSTVRGSGSAVCGSGSAVRGSVCRAWSGSICPCVGLGLRCVGLSAVRGLDLSARVWVWVCGAWVCLPCVVWIYLPVCGSAAVCAP